MDNYNTFTKLARIFWSSVGLSENSWRMESFVESMWEMAVNAGIVDIDTGDIVAPGIDIDTTRVRKVATRLLAEQLVNPDECEDVTWDNFDESVNDFVREFCEYWKELGV